MWRKFKLRKTKGEKELQIKSLICMYFRVETNFYLVWPAYLSLVGGRRMKSSDPLIRSFAYNICHAMPSRCRRHLWRHDPVCKVPLWRHVFFVVADDTATRCAVQEMALPSPDVTTSVTNISNQNPLTSPTDGGSPWGNPTTRTTGPRPSWARVTIATPHWTPRSTLAFLLLIDSYARHCSPKEHRQLTTDTPSRTVTVVT